MAAASIIFGTNANQLHHTFRHIVAAGMDRAAVQAAIETDIAANAGTIKSGLNTRSIMVGGQQITYHAFQFASGVINVGRITLP
jgi:predicted dienelactone hydrolase